ncbi:SDR family oxidoreductase [Arundinibacter roseus]|nr:SDR family oxidoreductase [Arundinibacter roseus]
MQKKIALITGPTSGIGKVTALELAKRNYNLIFLARDAKKADELQMEIGSSVETAFVSCDLSDLSSVQQAVAHVRQNYSRLDVLINNAGLILDRLEYSPNGIEKTFAINHVGHFLLTKGLIDLLKNGKDARIVTVSSEAHRIGKFRLDQLVRPEKFSSWGSYGTSKLANILFSNELAERVKPFGITSNALHPGGVATNFGSNNSGISKLMMWMARPFFKSPQEGAQTTIYLATSPEARTFSGLYFKDLKPKKPSTDAQSTFLAKELWKLSDELVRDFTQPNA